MLRSSRLVWSICALLIVTTMLGAAVLALDQWNDMVKDNKSDTRAIGFVLAEQMSRYLQVIDLTLQQVQNYAQPAIDRTPQQFHQRLATTAAHDFLVGQIHNLPQAHALAVVDRDGRLLASSRAFPTPALDLAGRDYLRYFRQQPNPSGVFISAPTVSKLSGIPVLFVARGIVSPEHVLLGVAVAVIDIDYLRGFFRAIQLQPGRIITLVRRDGLVLVRYPGPLGAIGRRMPDSSPWYAKVAAGGGAYRSPGVFGDGSALVSVHPLPRYPLVVNSTILIHEAMALWRHEAMKLGVAALLTSVALIVLFSIIAAQVLRLAERNAALGGSAAALRQSERRVRDFAEVSSDWFWEQDAELRFTWLSRTSPSERLGDETYRGKTRQELLRADQTDPKWAAHHADLTARRPFRDFRYQRVTADGTVLHVSVSGVPVFDDNGTFRGYRGTGRDITEQVRTEHDLRVEKERAESANRTKSEFIAAMSHELRTPLNAIIGFSELIRDQVRGPLPPGYVEFATDIHTSGRHLLELINDVLDLSRIESGHYELHEEVMQLAPLLRSCVGMLRTRARDAKVRLDHSTTDATVALRADRRAVRQVMLNLLENAVKFTPAQGQVRATIERRPDGDVALEVRDTGIGIDPGKLAELGEPFHQADASINRQFGGTGLGLAISHRLVTLHGGRLEISSHPGEGTVVSVTFPAERVVSEKETALS